MGVQRRTGADRQSWSAAAREGDFERLLNLLDPDVALRADPAAVWMGASEGTHGALAVAQFCRRAFSAQPALLDDTAAMVWMPGGELRVL